MKFIINHTLLFFFYFFITTFPFLISSLTPDGLTLLSLKSAITSSSTTSSAFSNWNESDTTPCKWLGITCSKDSNSPRVISITLSNRGLTGYIPSELGSLTSLRRLNLHTNHFTGPIPSSLFNATSLHSLFLYNNNLSGSLPSSLCNPTRLQNVDVSYNNLTSSIPHGIGQCHHLQRLIVSHNQFNDEIPSGVWSAMGELVQLDLSSNRFSGKIPVDLGELKSLSRSLNLSFNHLTGRIPKSLGNLPMTVSFDLRGNNLSGEIPQIGSFASQGPTAFLNNPLLCGFPLQKNCGGDNSSAPSTQDESSGQGLNSDGNGKNKQRNRLDAGTIVLISAADAAAVAFVGLIIIYIYWKKKDDSGSCSCTGTKKLGGFGISNNHNHNNHNKSSSHPFLCCINRLIIPKSNGSPNSDSEISSPEKDGPGSSTTNSGCGPVPGSGELVALDKSFSFELDELLRASAYVLGKSGLGIVYKVVLGNGIPVAVRRLGEGGGDQQRYKEFVLEVNAIAKVKHPNVVRLRAYYWAPDEKLLISDFVSNGNLANVMKGKTGQSTTNLTWSTRLQIAQGTSKGLAYLHECSPRKFVHGDIKPSNILIDTNYQPYISDFGLNRLITITGSDPSSSGGLMGGALPYIKPTTLHQPNNNPSSYKAPEARFPGTRPTQKWDVYSFGVVLLELLTGKSSTDMMMLMVSSSSPRASSSNSSSEVMNQQDLVKWVRKGFEDQIPLSEIVDPGLLSEVRVKKEVLSVFHLALACTESDPEIRPRMKNVADHLEKIRGS